MAIKKAYYGKNVGTFWNVDVSYEEVEVIGKGYDFRIGQTDYLVRDKNKKTFTVLSCNLYFKV